MTTNRQIRRGFLLGMTLLTMMLVVGGTMFLGAFLEANPNWFVTYWAVCFVCSMIVLALAFVDMRKVRQEFRARQVELDAELAKIVSNTEAIANETETEKIE